MEAQSKQARERDFVDITRAAGVNEEVARTVNHMLTYHPWDSEQIAQGKRVKEVIEKAVLMIIDSVPPCPTRSVAIRKLIEARMDCNNAITHGGRGY